MLSGERVFMLMFPPSESASMSGVAAFVTSIVSKNAPGILLVRKLRFMPPELAILLPSTVTELSV